MSMAIWMSYLLTKYISNPVNKLAKLMSSVENGDRTVKFNVKYNDEIGHLGTSFNNMVNEIHRLIDKVYKEKYLLKEAEFETLKAEINPHFLYNILNSINWMAKMGKCDDVSKMITTLGSFLRYNISKKEDVVTIDEDIKQVENYLQLQKMRYGDKFSTQIYIDPEIRQHKILKLLIQPIVENAIVHGIEPKIGKGLIKINGIKDNKNICFEVMDDGIGMNKSTSTGEGLGLQNVDKRIKIHYGEEYGVYIETLNNITCVKILIPYV
jgi:two-component system sensor histidine kinase YesM